MVFLPEKPNIIIVSTYIEEQTIYSSFFLNSPYCETIKKTSGQYFNLLLAMSFTSFETQTMGKNMEIL